MVTNLILDYQISTFPSQLQISTTQSNTQGRIDISVSSGSTPKYCSQMLVAIPVGTDATTFSEGTPSATVSTANWSVASTEIKRGSDWIKLLVTGAFMSAGDRPEDVHFSEEEVRTAVEEAARHGVPVMAHAHATAGIKLAIHAGVRSIEHGTFLDDEAIRLLVEHGTWLVPTLYIGDHYIEKGSPSGAQEKMVELSRKYRERHYAWVGEAIRAGVKIAAGSDFGGFDASLNAGEIEALHRAGMTPMQAIQAATRAGAELLGWQDRIGTVEPGKLADLVAVPGDPLADLSLLRRPVFVMLGGGIVRHDEQAGSRGAATLGAR